MVIRIASAVLSLAGLLALVSGLLFWTGVALNLVSLHMLLGLLAVGALWAIGVAQAFAKGGSWKIAASALFIGVLTVALGLYQSSLLIGAWHWIIDVTHLLLGVFTIGLGHMGAARYRKAMSAK
jgi:hypothetical protein